jgi:hypothetical protein
MFDKLQLWKRIKHLKNSEDGDRAYSETSVRASATRYQTIKTSLKASEFACFCVLLLLLEVEPIPGLQ